jgi:hypothetical protein
MYMHSIYSGFLFQKRVEWNCDNDNLHFPLDCFYLYAWPFSSIFQGKVTYFIYLSIFLIDHHFYVAFYRKNLIYLSVIF